MKSNIVLIGMAGCGKSTIGVLVAKMLGYDFIDTDLVLQKQENRLLREIISNFGLDYFKNAEERALLSLDVNHAVIATGGSAVYSDAAMTYLRRNAASFWLYIPFDHIESRVKDAAARGIVMDKGKTLRDIYNEREPLYSKYSDIRINCTDDVAHNAELVAETYRQSDTLIF